MNSYLLKKPRYIDTLMKILMFALPILAVVIAISCLSLYMFDKKNLFDAMNREVDNIQAINEQETYMASYTDMGSYRANVKNALLDFSERYNSLETYAVILNGDGLVKVSSQEALKGYFPAFKSPFFYCEESEILKWYRETVYPLVTDIDHRYVYPTAYVIPKEVYVSPTKNQFIISSVRLIHATMGENYYQVNEEDLGYYDFKHLLDNKYGFQKEDIYHEIEIKIKGVAADSPVFEKITEKGELIANKKHFGDIVYYVNKPLNDKTGSIVVFAYINVFADHAVRYIAVILSFALLTVILVTIISWLLFVSKKSSFERESYRIGLMNSLSHDLKTPLTAMSGYAENLLENVQNEKRNLYAQSIIKNVEYMNDIIRNVMILSKSEACCFEEKRTEIDLVNLSRNLWQKYELQAKERNLSIQIDGEYRVESDLTLMSIVVDNLLSNAIKYATEGSTITIKGNDGRYSIRNEIHEAIKNPKRLWEPFTKGDDSRSERNGSGLGLSIVKSIIEQQKMKAHIDADHKYFEVIIE